MTTIATAIEEQAAVTRDMARNIAEATTGVKDANQRVAQTASVSQEIARDIAAVNTASGEMTLGQPAGAGELTGPLAPGRPAQGHGRPLHAGRRGRHVTRRLHTRFPGRAFAEWNEGLSVAFPPWTTSTSASSC